MGILLVGLEEFLDAPMNSRMPKRKMNALKIERELLELSIARELRHLGTSAAVSAFSLLTIFGAIQYWLGHLDIRVGSIYGLLLANFAFRFYWSQRSIGNPGEISVRLWRWVFTANVAWGAACWSILMTWGWQAAQFEERFFYMVMMSVLLSTATFSLSTSGRDFIIFTAVSCASLSRCIWDIDNLVVRLGTLSVGLLYVAVTLMIRRRAFDLWKDNLVNLEWISVVLNAFPGGISVLQGDSYIYANTKVGLIVQQAAADIAGKKLGFKGPDSLFAGMVRDFRNSNLNSRQFELELGSPPRSHFILLTKFKSFKDLICVISIDVHDRVIAQKESEVQRAKAIDSARLASVGVMAAGIAHEINNPLAIISGLARAAIDKIQDWQKDSVIPKDHGLVLEKNLEQIDRSVHRIAKIIRGLRVIARDAEDDPKAMSSLNEIVKASLDFCQERFLKNGVELDVVYGPVTTLVLCREAQISQVILNLLNNAFDAVAKLNNPRVKIETFEDETRIGFYVEDSGPGIPADIKDKIMSPFFTTKAVGQGTGLGLTIASSIIADHQGHLKLDGSSKNTKFVVEFPKAAHSTGEKEVA
ncbi:MAG: hypothetical protein C5B49_08450 [Bdellovibrio sp.]|nr:MAG: hypothetical protein C5B49_08450 [Bdellovibrio sp.]